MKNRIIITIIVILAIGVVANGYFYCQESNRLRDVQAKVATLEGNVAMLTDNISALTESVPRALSTLTADASTWKGDVATLKGDTSALKGALSTLTRDTSILSGNISALNGNIQSLRDEASSNFKAFRTYTSAVTDTVMKFASVVVRIDVTGNGFQASGSGTIISKNGYVLTNEHVISDAKSIKITLTNGQQYNAVIVSTDKDRDLAILKIATSGNFQEIVLGAADDIVVGKDVLAIGFALGPDFGGTPTVTRGIVSAVRTFQGSRYIQTDAAVNPGNSGGCLVTFDGKMIGVPSSRIVSGAQQIESIGFAIPIDEVKFFIQQTLG